MDHLTPEDECTTYLRNVVCPSPITMQHHISEDRNPRPFHSFPQGIQTNFQLAGLNGNWRGASVRISGVGGGIGCTQGLRERVRAPVKKKKNSAGPQHGRAKSERLTLSCGGTWAGSKKG